MYTYILIELPGSSSLAVYNLYVVLAGVGVDGVGEVVQVVAIDVDYGAGELFES